MKPFIKYQIIIFILTLISSIVALANPVILKIVIDRVLILQETYLLKYVVSAILLFYILGTLVSFLSGFFSNYIGQKISLKLRSELFKHIQKLKLKNIIDSNMGDFIAKTVEDVNTITGFLSNTLVSTISDLLNLFATTMLMLYFSWKLSLIAITITLLQLYISVKYSGTTRSIQKLIRNKSSEHMSFLKESLSNIRSIKAFNRETETQITYFRLLKSILNLNFKNFYIYFEYSTIVSFASFLGAILIFTIGVYEVFHGNLTIGILFVFDSISERFSMFASKLVNLNISLQGVFVAFERLESIFKLEIEEAYNSKLTFEKDEVRFDNVSFKYESESNKLVLDEFSFTFKPGEIYVVIGKSGEGKSTLTNLLLNLYDFQGGQVYIGNNKLKDIKLKSLRNKISVIFQDSNLVSGSIADNMKYGCKNVSIEQMISASKICCIYDFIKCLPKKFDTNVGDLGEKLSGGQRQRICIARGILKESDIYVFDEALCNLDKNLEVDVFRNVQAALKGKTQIYITHNIELVKKMKNIIVINNGKVEAVGRHEELLHKSLVYEELFTKGMKSIEEKEYA